MTKCLITKLNGKVEDTSLPYFGGIRFKVYPVDNPTVNTQVIGIHTDKPTKAIIVGNGYFTDSSLITNEGTTKELVAGRNEIYVSNGEFDVIVFDKYDITNVRFHLIDVSAFSSGRGIDMMELNYLKKLQNLEVSLTKKVTGDISALADLLELTKINLAGTDTSGDISALKNLTKLTYLNLENTKSVSGDISAFSNLKELVTLSSYFLKGNISSIGSLSKLKSFKAYFSDSLTGDLAALPASVNSFYFLYSATAILSWSSRPSSASIIAINSNALLNNVDKMLQDQAACVDTLTSSVDKQIAIRGTRTSASDSAIAILQSKGYTVSITPA